MTSIGALFFRSSRFPCIKRLGVYVALNDGVRRCHRLLHKRNMSLPSSNR